MIQCANCEFGEKRPNGTIHWTCDPSKTIVEPECLAKWQLMCLQSLRIHAERVTELMPELKTMLDVTGPIALHVSEHIAEQAKADDWKDGAHEDEEPAA